MVAAALHMSLLGGSLLCSPGTRAQPQRRTCTSPQAVPTDPQGPQAPQPRQPAPAKLKRASQRAAPRAPGPLAPAEDDIVGWSWTGSDQFSALGDRRDLPPLPLPDLPGGTSRLVAMVRHGQSTWNARSRIQVGSGWDRRGAQGPVPCQHSSLR